MKATIFTWEFPPNIYGGAGVHAKYIATSLSKLIDVEVRTLEEGPPPDIPGLSVRRYRPRLKPLGVPDPKVAKALEVLSFNMNMVADPIASDIVHTHTWYTNFAGAVAKRTYGTKLVATVHSLEPLRPWKREQLGAGYELSLWMEREGLIACDAIIAVSPDTEDGLRRVLKQTPNVGWIRDMLEDPDLVSLYNEAAVFACSSIYEPFGIINLEAMACETPVVATRVGGIKEVVVDGETGLLVPPGDPVRLGKAITKVIEDPKLAARMGKAGRKRVLQHFTWDRIAEKTLKLYRTLT